MSTDVCILGAGPHGLAAAVHLREASPDIAITVVDRSPRWLHTWANQFSRAGITTLRSPSVHHPAPNPYALKDFAADNRLPRSGLEYDLPRADVFLQFCATLIERARVDPPLALAPRTIRSNGTSLKIESGDTHITASNLIVAANPHRRSTPDWVEHLLGHEPGLLANAYDVDLPALPDLTDQRVVIIGGGLTAAHLAIGAADRGAQSMVISRRNLSIRSFDTAPGWLGPKYMRIFDEEADPARRLAMVLRARSGGSVPEWMHAALTAHDNVELREATVVRSSCITQGGICSLQLSDGTNVPADRVWLATGTRPDATALRCLQPLLEDVVTMQGLPIVDDNLRLGPHRAYVMGRLATLTLGPAAGNLWGAQRAAQRITRAITGIDLAPEAPSMTRSGRN